MLSCVQKSNDFVSSDSIHEKDISLQINQDEFSARYLKYSHETNSIWYLDRKNSFLTQYSVEGLKLDSIDVKTFGKIDDYFIQNSDSIYLSIEDENKIILINSTRPILKEYNLNVINDDKIPFYIYNYKDFPLKVKDNSVYTYHYLEDETSKENLPSYFSKPRELVFNLQDSVYLKFKMGKFPTNYKNENYNEMNPMRTFGSNGSIIYTFEASDSVFIYNDKGILTKSFKLDNGLFVKNSTIDESNIPQENYFNEIEKYIVENDRFGNLIYNESKDEYYRILKKGISYKKSDGTKNLIEDCQWLVLIYNNNFQLSKTIEFNPSLYAVYSLIVLNENKVLVPYLNNNDDNKTTFAVFNFN